MLTNRQRDRPFGQTRKGASCIISFFPLSGGDRYTRLNQFGRAIDGKWADASTFSYTVRFRFGDERVGQQLYEEQIGVPPLVW